ncbi:MAG: ECF transporter S component [Clostridia bacterium]|nr:ECF transporter S component [Clostridia bacterium]
MTNQKRKAMSTKNLVMYAVLTAIVVILQYLGAFIKFGPFSISLVLVPIVIGAALLGPLAGAWLGTVFGITVLWSGDATAFLTVNVVGTVITVLAKGALSGLVTGLAFKLLNKYNLYLAIAVSAIVCPVVNTGVFLIGCFLFFMETITGWAQGLGFESTSGYIIYGLVGGNFLFEVLINIILAPAIVRLLKIKNFN